MAQIANPIYDAAFKYLMDDPRVAKTLIAAVLQIDKKDILELTPDRNEISIYKKDDILKKLKNCFDFFLNRYATVISNIIAFKAQSKKIFQERYRHKRRVR